MVSANDIMDARHEKPERNPGTLECEPLLLLGRKARLTQVVALPQSPMAAPHPHMFSKKNQGKLAGKVSKIACSRFGRFQEGVFANYKNIRIPVLILMESTPPIAWCT